MASAPLSIKTDSDEKNYPYFFKNSEIDENMYIVQRCSSLEKCLYVIDVWNKKGYNISDVHNTISSDNFSYNLYVYVSPKNIEKHQINGGDEDFKVLTYNMGGIIYHCCLLRYEPRY